MSSASSAENLDASTWLQDVAANAEQVAEPRPAEPVVALSRALQRELIPRIARAHRRTLAQITPHDVEQFTAEVLQGDEAVLVARLEHLRQQGFGAHTLCLDLLAPAARRLGEMWNDDRCDFASVTLGTGHLQRLLRVLAPGAWPRSGGTAVGMQLLLAQSPQEQHSFGLSMVAQFFTVAGWSVAGGVGDKAITPAARAQMRHFDVVGFSVGSESQLDWLREQIHAVRLASLNPRVLIMVGGPLLVLRPQWAADLGADLCPANGHEAPLLAARMASLVAAPGA
jgi:methanogenic corrinoid protein MtbC1